MIRSHHWQNSSGKTIVLSQAVILALMYLTIPVPTEHHDVEYRHSLVADNNLKIGWETKLILAMQTVDNSLSIDDYCYCSYRVHVLIRHYLATGRKYMLIKKYALNKHVRLLTRLYGITRDDQH